MKIDFDKNFYSKKALASSIEAFKELASFKIEQKKGYFSVLVEPLAKKDASLLGDEFSNFALFASLKERS